MRSAFSIRRLLSVSLILSMLVSMLPLPALATDGQTEENAIINNSFELPSNATVTAPFFDDSQVEGWSTTATDHKIEFGRTSRAPHLTGSDKTIPDGVQFAELNANQMSTLYQNLDTVGGHVYEWGLSHRGRSKTDTMALIIGPEQEVAPAKPSAAGQDQFMRLTAWIKLNAATLGVTVPTVGCSQRITVYSKAFAEKGDFQNSTGSESPFSTEPSNVYTEVWNVWLISTQSTAWGNYGTNSADYDALKGVGGGLEYMCSYSVPEGQTRTTFAFCSYNSGSVGNLLDDLHFNLYHTITISTTTGGQGTASSLINGVTSSVAFTDSEPVSILVRNNRVMTLQAVAQKSGEWPTAFVGAYITRQSSTGAVTYFASAAEDWTLESEDENSAVYTYQGTVIAPTDVVLVFVQSPAVTYDANGGDTYVYTPGALEPTNVVSLAPTAETVYTSHAAEASQKDGWAFKGWLLARTGTLLPAEHTVTYDADSRSFTFTADGMENVNLSAAGIALIAQWSWRQTFVTQLQQADGSFAEDTSCGTASVSGAQNGIYYADTGEQVTAEASAGEGYVFLGWYRNIDGYPQLVSRAEEYTYTVGKEDVQTVYARFAATHTITYQWTTDDLPEDVPEPPQSGVAVDGATYAISQDFVQGQTTIPGVNAGVPGNWVFQGWRVNGAGNYLGAEIAKVTGDMTLVGSWAFIANSQWRLTYSAGENTTNWIPSGLEEVAQDSYLYYYKSEVTAAPAPEIPAHNANTLSLSEYTAFSGTWTFLGWKSSDDTVTKLIQPGEKFSMPNQSLSLTAQWSFTPDVYRVEYYPDADSERLAEQYTYDYPEIEGKDGVVQAEGIPFGAPLDLLDPDLKDYTPEGKYFAGWSLDPNGAAAYQSGQMVNEKSLQVEKPGETVKLYAIFADVHTITLDFSGIDPDWGYVNNRSGSFTVAGTAISGDDVVSTAIPRPGYCFAGWTCEGSAVASDGATITVTAGQMTADQAGSVLHYVANFLPITFTVAFDANRDGDSGEGTMENQVFRYVPEDADFDEEIYLRTNTFTRYGYRFVGWAEYPDGSGITYGDQSKFRGVYDYQGRRIDDNDTITLYAQWQAYAPVTMEYTPFPAHLGTVKLNEAAAGEAENGSLNSQSAYTVRETGNPDPQVHQFAGATAVPGEDSVFEGWFDQQEELVSEELTLVPQPEDGLYQGVSYVARFHMKQHTLTYHANDGTEATVQESFKYGEDQSLSRCMFTRPGYDFMGWAVSPEGSVVYANQQSLAIREDTDLYAVWQEQQVTILYQSQNSAQGTVTRESETLAAVAGTAQGSEARPGAGYVFAGWYDEADNKVSDQTIFIPDQAGDVWQGTVYTARFASVSSDSNDDDSSGGKNPTTIFVKEHVAYIQGYPDNTVRPNAAITRAETASIFYRLLNDKTRTAYQTTVNDFYDVADDAWYAAAVSTLSALGIITGYPDGSFRPNQPITRAEFAAITAQFDSKTFAPDSPFPDAQEGWFAGAVARAYDKGWIAGYPDGSFRPYEDITRAAAVTAINRVLQRLPASAADLASGIRTWPDMPADFWGYVAMEEAANSHQYKQLSNGHEKHTKLTEAPDWLDD